MQLYQYELTPDNTPRPNNKLADITEHSHTISATQPSSIKRDLPQPPALQTDNISRIELHNNNNNMCNSITYFHDNISPLQQLLQQQQSTAQTTEPIHTKPTIQRPLSYTDPNSDWKRGELLGSGAYGQVYLALHLITGQLMAVKQVPLNNCNKANTAITALQHEG